MPTLHLWHAELGSGAWPGAGDLPAVERDRAAAMQLPRARGRWVASRWALRSVLGLYLDRDPTEVELLFGEHGKPMLAVPERDLRFNLSHSGELALIAVCEEREIGVDVQRLGRRPAGFCSAWTRREAVAKCHGTGLWAPLPDTPVAVVEFGAGVGFAAAAAVAGTERPALRHFESAPPSSASRSNRALSKSRPACGGPRSPFATA